jgi:hypothetical protein
MYPEIHDLARKIMLAGKACEQRQRTSRHHIGCERSFGYLVVAFVSFAALAFPKEA